MEATDQPSGAGPQLPEPGARQWFIFAMKDSLPLGPDGWSVGAHQPECADVEGNMLCLSGRGPCFGTVAYFIGSPHQSNTMSLAIGDLFAVIDMLTKADRETEPEIPEGVDPDGSLRWVAAAATAVRDGDQSGDVFNRCFDLVADAVAALRNATGAGIADPTIERMHPWYLTAHESPDGVVEATGVVIVDHVMWGPPPPATPKQLELAQHLLLHRFRRSPIENYRTFALQARLAVNHEGDYTKAVLLAAVACEVLIKNVAWMLTFEASRMETDPTPSVSSADLGALKPSQLIGRVLQPRLGASWASSNSTQAVGAWRHHIARTRSQILHRGRRATALEADEALIALRALERHISDRIASRGHTYPRTAYIQVGVEGLQRRDLLKPVLAALADAPEQPDDFVAEYLLWLNVVLEQDEADAS